MKNQEEEHREQQLEAEAVTATTASPTLAERITSRGLEPQVTQRLTQLTQGLDTATDELLDTLVQGITHDNDVQNADAEGYLRGRNEKIEAVLPPKCDTTADEPQSTPIFPQYCRRSIWD